MQHDLFNGGGKNAVERGDEKKTETKQEAEPKEEGEPTRGRKGCEAAATGGNGGFDLDVHVAPFFSGFDPALEFRGFVVAGKLTLLSLFLDPALTPTLAAFGQASDPP